jgi:uncharacterized membrane protein
LGDLALGLLGAVAAGSTLRLLGTTSASSGAQVAIGVVGAVLLVATSRVAARAAARRHPPDVQPVEKHPFLDLEAHLKRLGEHERRVLTKLLRREPVSRDAIAAFEKRLPIGDRIADRVARFGGSWTFILLFLALMSVWMAYNTETQTPWDPFPFILLNLALSCLAAMQAPVIMMSQNRQAIKDRLDAQNDYQVNIKAEMEVTALHLKLDELREQHLADLATAQRQQREVLARIENELQALRAHLIGQTPA